MIALTRVKQATKDFVKVLRFGKSDIKTADPIFPHGVDSKPVKKDVAVHASTSNDSVTVCLGYVKNSDKTSEGELCLYATDNSGSRVFEMYFKNDGSVEFGGSGDFLARFNEIKDGFDEFVGDFNSFIDTYNAHTHPDPSSGSTGTPSATGSNSNASIDDAKIDEIEVSG